MKKFLVLSLMALALSVGCAQTLMFQVRVGDTVPLRLNTNYKPDTPHTFQVIAISQKGEIAYQNSVTCLETVFCEVQVTGLKDGAYMLILNELYTYPDGAVDMRIVGTTSIAIGKTHTKEGIILDLLRNE